MVPKKLLCILKSFQFQTGIHVYATLGYVVKMQRNKGSTLEILWARSILSIINNILSLFNAYPT